MLANYRAAPSTWWNMSMIWYLVSGKFRSLSRWKHCLVQLARIFASVWCIVLGVIPTSRSIS